MDIKHYLWKQIMRLKNRSCTIDSARLAKDITLGKSVTLGYGSSIAAKSIGDFTYINKYCLIDKNVVAIGKYCSIAYNVRIGLGGHPTNWLSTHPFAYSKKYGFVDQDKPWTTESEKTIIGNDVWIGANATILAGITVGDGAIIGAHALVNKDVEPFSIVVGSPARHVRFRHNPEIIEKLMAVKWWDMSEAELKKLVHQMDDPSAIIKSL